MPYTKRLAHHGSPKDLIDYILDEKNKGEKVAVASSINCSVETAFSEFKRTQKRYDMQGNRTAYHIIQSFSPDDNITAEQANEIGKRLCQELYPDFQCIISTHDDRGHLHNHIAINAINIKGRKLEDKLSNEKEGLYGMSDMSDKIAGEYGCYIMPKRTFSKIKNKDYYYQYKEQTWKEKIKEDIEPLIAKSDSVEELLEELSILGYEIRRGKHVAVKITGMQKFARLSTIDEKYSEENLHNYFKSKTKINLQNIKTRKNKFNKDILENAKESKAAIEKSSAQAKKKVYTEYQKTRYQEIKRFYNLKQQLEYLEKYNIKNFDDIEMQIAIKRKKIKLLNIKLKKNDKDIIKITEKAQDYIKLYKTYKYAMEYRRQDVNYIFPKEVEIFLKLGQELNIKSVDEAKELIKNTRAERIEINKIRSEILNLQRELNHLDTIKEEKLSKSNLFIHNIKFGGNRIDYPNSNDKVFCVNLPYTEEKIHIEKKFTAFNEKHQFYTLYLVDDKKYEIFDKENKKMKELTGTELERYVLNKKKEIDKLYQQKDVVN